MRFLTVLSLMLCLAGAPHAEEAPVPKIAFTLSGIPFAERDVIVTDKRDYVHILLDLFPYKGKYKAEQKTYLALGEAVVKEVHQKKYPAQTKFKVDLVEFKDRDEYGEPSWSSVRILFRREYAAGVEKKAAVKTKKTVQKTKKI